MEIETSLNFSSQSLVAAIFTLLALLLAVRSLLFKKLFGATSANSCGDSKIPDYPTGVTAYMNGVGGGSKRVAAERLTGASMMEQLVPEITTHALSYLDYSSLCRLSMTNSLMRKAANDDNAWKALYHKDFTLEQDSVTPVNGWKAYYAATRAVMNVNEEFIDIVRERSLMAMGHFWLNADYVKCVHLSGELFSGYNAVMQSWQLAFNWDQEGNIQVRDVRIRVMTDIAWVTMKTNRDMGPGPYSVTNIYEFHNGRWFMVHHHYSVMLLDGVAGELHNGHH
ncbi:SnoaL_3 domain-containing protein [Cephalotus follicularis]|uniref:SnoaL_3 domain-containing protein n=1 Tax=Cephalotus follicularis TaxID=3775 RepID=A0A1Q3D8S0_CEPFO|nr:SnoaL_3 domain-containing protein [Cephalotus follicularis]